MKTVPVERAVIFVPPALQEIAGWRVGGLPLLQRTLRVLDRAGIRQVTIISASSWTWPRQWSNALSLRVTRQEKWKACGEEALVFTGDLSLGRQVIPRLLENSAAGINLWSLSGEGGPAFVLGPVRGTFATFAEVVELFGQGTIPSSPLPGGWTCVRIRHSRDRGTFQRRIERDLVKSADGLFAQWNRRVSIPITRFLAHLPVTPDMITYFTLAVSAYGGYWLARGGYWEMLLGALVTQAASILDGNDGELARLKVVDGDRGTWLDTICDYVSYFFTFGGISYGLYNRTGASSYLSLGAVMFSGAILAMLTTSYLRRYRVPRGRAGDFRRIASEGLASQPKDLAAVIGGRISHFATRATFSYFLVLFGALDFWPLVLVLAAVGAHLFWILGLYNSKYVRAT